MACFDPWVGVGSHGPTWRTVRTPSIGARVSVVAAGLLLCPPILLAQPRPAQVKAAGLAADTVALISLEDDPRYRGRRLEHAYPGHPGGRLLAGAQLGLDDGEVALRGVQRSVKLREVTVPSADGLVGAVAQLQREGVRFWLLDLPAEAMPPVSQAAGAQALLFNLSAPQDGLRGRDCAAQLLHTAPSHTMLADALVQYLVARSWKQAWVLQGPTPQDAQLLDAWNRAAKRYGMQNVAVKPFRLSGDPRERDWANTRLLTSDRQHDVVAVLDADGEFARTLPYATQQPRPVVGSNGLMALAWHPQWERNGGPQVSRRFRKLAGRAMTGPDWAAWMATRAVVAVLAEQPQASVVEHARALRSGRVFVDGAKGPRLSFRAWDGQLRQPLFLAHGDGVVGTAPVDGVLHPTEVLDTLGVDQKESLCKAAP